MAVWIRILDLPVKYYKDYALYKIGGIIGPVVKVDKVTLGQTRGKFCRICVEINLDEPLKPFIELGDNSFGVVYEGISTICFNCGVYGHVRDYCSYSFEAQIENVKASPNVVTNDPMIDTPSMDNEMLKPVNNVVVDQLSNAVATSKTKADMGSWMVMSYKNRKKISNATSSGTKKTVIDSRFAPLQVDDVDSVIPKPADVEKAITKIVGPNIVQLWQRMQEKTKTDIPKKTHVGSKSVLNSIPAGPASRKPTIAKTLKDISNVASSSKSAVSVIKSPFPINCDLANSSSDSHPFVSMDAHFGHSPLDETRIEKEFIPVDLPDHRFING